MLRSTSMATSVALTLTLFSLEAAHAAGQKPKQENPSAPQLRTPAPVRYFHIDPVDSQVFNLPNLQGDKVDLTADLTQMLRGVMSDTPNIRARSSGNEEFCGGHLRIKAGIDNLQMSAITGGLSFGYTLDGGDLNAGGNKLGVDAGVKTDVVSMVIGLVECNGQASCVEPISQQKDNHVVGVDVRFSLKYDQSVTAASFLANTGLGNGIRNIMRSALQGLSSSPNFNYLAWHAKVDGVRDDKITFNKGWRDGLRREGNETFAVYKLSLDSGVCASRKIADVHTLPGGGVGFDSSYAIVDRFYDAIDPIQAGDIVKIEQATPAGVF